MLAVLCHELSYVDAALPSFEKELLRLGTRHRVDAHKMGLDILEQRVVANELVVKLIG
jgi:hypothetical protein